MTSKSVLKRHAVQKGENMIDKDKLIEMATSSGILDTVLIGREEYYNFSHEELFKFADLVSAHAIALQSEVPSMQTEQPVTREEIINIAEKAGAYVGGNYPQLIEGNHQVKVFEYTKKVIELVRSTNTDGWVLTLIDDYVIRTYKFYALKNALNAQQDWLEQGIKSTIQPAPVTSMQESISEKCTSEPTESYQLHEIFSSIEECPPIFESDSFIVKRVKEMAQLINSLSSDGWVSVDDRLPEKFTNVLITNGANEGYARLDLNNRWNIVASNDYVPPREVTHWRKFPSINAISQDKGESV